MPRHLRKTHAGEQSGLRRRNLLLEVAAAFAEMPPATRHLVILVNAAGVAVLLGFSVWLEAVLLWVARR